MSKIATPQAIAGALVLLVAAIGCSAPSTSDAPSAEPAAADRNDRLATATFALAYQAEPDSELERAQQAARKSPHDAAAFVRLAEMFFAERRESGDPALLGYARDALNAARALAPKDPSVLRTEALFAMEEHQFALARARAQEATALNPDDVGAWLLASDALLELGAYDDAIEALQQAMDRFPDLRSYSRTAYLRWLHGDHDGAVEAMHTAFEYAGETPEPRAWCYVDLGWFFWHSGQLDEARQAVESAYALVPAYLPAMSLDARLHAAQGNREVAITTLEASAERLPTAGDLLYLSELLEQAGRMDDAAARVAQADQLADHDPLPLALYHARRGTDPERALALAEAALAERDTVFTRDALALALARAGRIDEAKRSIEKALRLGTADPRINLHSGLIALAAGDRDAARAALDTAKSQTPHIDPALIAELERGLKEAL